MANGRIDVYFHSGGNEESSNEENGANQDGTLTTKKKTEKDKARQMMQSMAISYAKKSMSYGLSIMGDLTGDYQSQKQIESVISIATTGMMMAQFPVGTIAGVFSLATQTASTLISMHKQNQQAALYAQRTGNETINNSEVD